MTPTKFSSLRAKVKMIRRVLREENQRLMIENQFLKNKIARMEFDRKTAEKILASSG